MKNRLLLILGFITIGFGVTGGALSVSAKEKPDVVIAIDADQDFTSYAVSRGTLLTCNSDFVLSIDKAGWPADKGNVIHFDALLPVAFYLDRVSWQNDPYLHRSEQWIRNRNLFISGLDNTFDTNKSYKTQFLS
jgi:hypothetical protein